MKAKISLKAEKEIHPSRRLQNDCNKPEDTIKMKEDRKVGKGIDPAKNCMSGQSAPEK